MRHLASVAHELGTMTIHFPQRFAEERTSRQREHIARGHGQAGIALGVGSKIVQKVEPVGAAADRDRLWRWRAGASGGARRAAGGTGGWQARKRTDQRVNYRLAAAGVARGDHSGGCDMAAYDRLIDQSLLMAKLPARCCFVGRYRRQNRLQDSLREPAELPLVEHHRATVRRHSSDIFPVAIEQQLQCRELSSGAACHFEGDSSKPM